MAKNSIVDSIVSGINKQYKKVVIARCSDIIDDLKVTFIPTPSLKLNEMLSGGVARGKIFEVFGPSGSGKTTLCYQIIGESMKADPKVIWGWLETEGSFDVEVAKHYGIDTDRLIFWEMTEDGAEGALDILDGIITQADGQIEGIVINSVAGLTPRTELINEISKADMGVQAKMMSKLMRKITAKCNKTKCAVIFINQVRDSMSLYGGQVTTGGKALAFFSSQRLEMRKVKAEAADGVKESEYIKMKCKTKKNRFAKGNPYLETEIFGRYGHGIDTSMEVLQLAIAKGLIEKKAGGNYRYVTLKGEELKWRGASSITDFCDKNEWFNKELISRIGDTAGTVVSQSDDEIRNNEEEAAKNSAEMSEYLDDGGNEENEN